MRQLLVEGQGLIMPEPNPSVIKEKLHGEVGKPRYQMLAKEQILPVSGALEVRLA